MRINSTTIGDLVARGALLIGDGYRTKRSELGEPGYRIIRVADVGDGTVSLESPDFIHESRAQQIGVKAGEPGDVLVTTKGTVGRVAVLPSLTGPVVYSPQVCFFRVLDEAIVDPRFLRYWFASPEFLRQASDRMNNTDMAAYINLADVRSLQLTLPPTDDQRAIADVLSAFDDKIAANSAADATIDKLIESLYLRAISDPGTIDAPFFEAFDVDFGEPFAGGGFTEPGNGRPLIRIRDLKTFTPKVWTIERREREVVIEPGDVIVGMDAEFRPTWWLGEPGLLNQRVCRVSSRHTGPAFVREALRSPLRAIEDYKSGTTVIHLNKGDLALTRVALPPRAALAEFESKAETLFRRRVASAREHRVLAGTRDALLPALMAARVGVNVDVRTEYGSTGRSARTSTFHKAFHSGEELQGWT